MNIVHAIIIWCVLGFKRGDLSALFARSDWYSVLITLYLHCNLPTRQAGTLADPVHKS